MVSRCHVRSIAVVFRVVFKGRLAWYISDEGVWVCGFVSLSADLQ